MVKIGSNRWFQWFSGPLGQANLSIYLFIPYLSISLRAWPPPSVPPPAPPPPPPPPPAVSESKHSTTAARRTTRIISVKTILRPPRLLLLQKWNLLKIRERLEPRKSAEVGGEKTAGFYSLYSTALVKTSENIEFFFVCEIEAFTDNNAKLLII